MSAPSMPEPVSLDAATILERAVDAARDRAGILFDGLATLDAMGSADHVEIKGEALKWLAEKFGADVREIMNDLDHAQRATVGGVYATSAVRYGTPDDDPRFRDLIWHATGGAVGEPPEDRAEAADEKGVCDTYTPGGARNLDSDHDEKNVIANTLNTIEGETGPNRLPDEKMTLDNSEGHSGGAAADAAQQAEAAAEKDPHSERTLDGAKGINSVDPVAAEGVHTMHTPDDGRERRSDLPADPTWPGGLDLRELYRALSGVAGCLAGLDSLGAGGSMIDADYLGPPIETLITWKRRVEQAHDALEAQTAGAEAMTDAQKKAEK